MMQTEGVGQRAIALGDDCSSAYQLRRMTGNAELGVLDWAYTPAETLNRLISTDFANFFDRANLQIREGGDAVIDISNGMLFFHDFSRHPELGITREIFEAEFEKTSARYRFLVERWRMLRQEKEKLLFARTTRGADESHAQLYETLRGYFRSSDLTLLFFRRGVPPGCSLQGRVLVYDVMHDAGPAPEHWRGNDANWDAAMAELHRALPEAGSRFGLVRSAAHTGSRLAPPD